MSRAAIAKDLIVAQARDLKMPGLRRAYEQLGRQAREEHWTHEDYLHQVLAAQQTSRHESAIRHRIHDAKEWAGGAVRLAVTAGVAELGGVRHLGAAVPAGGQSHGRHCIHEAQNSI